MGKLDGLNAALDNLDAATTAHATALADLAERVKNDDITPEELGAAVARAAASAEAISGLSTSVAGIEPTSVPLPDPVEEIPVEEPPADGGTVPTSEDSPIV